MRREIKSQVRATEKIIGNIERRIVAREESNVADKEQIKLLKETLNLLNSQNGQVATEGAIAETEAG